MPMQERGGNSCCGEWENRAETTTIRHIVTYTCTCMSTAVKPRCVHVHDENC